MLNALNSEVRGFKVRFSLATIVFETFELILCQMLSSQGKNAPSNPYPHYLVRLAASRLCGDACRVLSGVVLPTSVSSDIQMASGFETRSACYRGPKPQKCPKWSGEGAKGVLTSWRDSLPRASTSATLICTSATSCTSATGLWSTCTKTPFAPSPNYFGHFRGFGLL